MENRALFAVSLDPNGWTVVTPAADTRVVYVSSSAGSDASAGLSEQAPVRTIAKARTLVRSGSADWMLLRRGDTFYESILQWDKTGRSAQEPVLIGAYGAGAERPALLTGTANGFTTGATPVSNVYVIGLRFESHLRNPDRPGFNADLAGGSYGVQMLSRSDNVLFEDVVVEAYKTNVSIGRYVTPAGVDRYASNVTVRRSQVLDAYNRAGNSQGLYAEHVRGLRLEENVFDHNGWDPRAGAAQTQLNHNVYLHSSTAGVVFAGNVSANASSHGLQARGGGSITGNLFLSNPIGMSFGLVNGSTARAGGVSGEVAGNVFLGSASIGTQGRGWGLEIGNTRPGGGTAVRDNVFAHDTVLLYPAIMLNYGFGGDNSTSAVGLNDLTIERNVVYKWHQGLSTSRDFLSGGTGQLALNDLVVRDNDFQTFSGGRLILQNHARNLAEESWSDNRYWSSAPAGNWFSQQGAPASFDAWRAGVEPTARQEKQAYADPERTVATYNATLGGPATAAAFSDGLRRQSAASWDPAYTAGATIAYVREGFRLDNAAPTAVLSAPALLAAGTTHTFSVVYADDSAIDDRSLGGGDVRVTGPAGYDQLATLVSVAPADGGRAQIATYQVAAPGGTWEAATSGVYAVTIRPGEVADAAGRFVAAGVVGTFAVVLRPAAPPADAVAPRVTYAKFEARSSGDRLVFRFSERVAPSLSLEDFVIGRTKAGVPPLSRSAMRLTINEARNEAVITFPGLRGRKLRPAQWRATLAAAGITDAAHNQVDGNRDGRGGDDFVMTFKRG